MIIQTRATSSRRSANGANSVFREVTVGGDDREIVLERRSNDETVGWVFVMPWQFGCSQHIVGRKLQDVNVVPGNNGVKSIPCRTRQNDLPLCRLYGNLPCRHRRNANNLRIGNCQASRLGKTSASRRKPKQCACVKQQRVSHSSPPSPQIRPRTGRP